MGSMNYFGQVVQEILQNNHWKTNFEDSEIKNFIRGKFSKKNLVFWTLNAHILRTVNTRELNGTILKSSY